MGYRPLPSLADLGLVLADLLAQRLRGASPDRARYARSADRSPAPAGCHARSAHRGTSSVWPSAREHPFLPGHDPGFKASVKPGTAHYKQRAATGGATHGSGRRREVLTLSGPRDIWRKPEASRPLSEGSTHCVRHRAEPTSGTLERERKRV